MPFDQNRVRLSVQEGGNDYINASLITLDLGADLSIGSKKYIATQGPTRTTVNHFWQMLYSLLHNDYKSDSAVIVMLTPVHESGREACAPYWPSEVGSKLEIPSDEDFPQALEVSCISSQMVAPPVGTTDEQYPHTQCDLKLTCPEKGITKTIHHIYVDTWVDFDRPKASGDIFSLVRLCNSLQASTSSRSKQIQAIDAMLESPPTKDMPMIVHCSAGVGRTGTYMALDYMLTRSKLLNADTPPSVYSTISDPIYELVKSMREQRMGMVQRFSQYKYIYENVRTSVPSKE